jgi:heme/copper-type cytochrome/quinol oxidase subunit 2
MEKAQLPAPEHASFQQHRREIWRQILLPVIFAGLILLAVVALTTYATFRQEGDVARWAAISTIWIVIPVIVVSLIFFILFAAMIYGMARLLKLIPPYSGEAQRYVWKAQGYVQRGADAVTRPILGLDGMISSFKKMFGIK